MKHAATFQHKHQAPEGTLGARVRRARAENGMTQTELSVASGVDRVTILNIEGGKYADCSLARGAALARALDVSLDYLAGNSKDFGKSPCEHCGTALAE